MSDEDDFRLKTKARKSRSRGEEVNIPTNDKGFHEGVRAALERGIGRSKAGAFTRQQETATAPAARL